MRQTVGLVFLFFAIAVLLFGVFHLTHSQQPVVNPMSKSLEQNTPPSPTLSPASSTLFVPYWTLDGSILPETYNRLVYFGITADENGIAVKEDGYLHLPTFLRLTSSAQQTLLAVRLINNQVNEKILSDKNLQDKIITDSISLAKKDGFSGIVLDFEYKALAFDSVVNHTSNLSQQFADAAHKNNLLYFQTLYGDTFYRLRPFDVEKIGKSADGIFVMAYDFHKANGNPGPNFPLLTLSDEDYSFQQMIKDFVAKVAPQKITILFGLFGYDWKVNDKNQSLEQASVLTTNEAENKFTNCKLKACHILRDSQADEEHVRYSDSDGQQHDVWFEDMTSVEKKEAYLKTQGISATGFWAYSYF